MAVAILLDLETILTFLRDRLAKIAKLITCLLKPLTNLRVLNMLLVIYQEHAYETKVRSSSS
jgi:BarA-like signal transduction histidine kinase